MLVDYKCWLCPLFTNFLNHLNKPTSDRKMSITKHWNVHPFHEYVKVCSVIHFRRVHSFCWLSNGIYRFLSSIVDLILHLLLWFLWYYSQKYDHGKAGYTDDLHHFCFRLSGESGMYQVLCNKTLVNLCVCRSHYCLYI